MSDDANFDEEIKRDFLDEVTGLLDECEESYLKLEDPSCRVEELGKIFRAVHSMKGAGAAVGFTDLASFAHVVEDCLSLLRGNSELVDTDVISILLQSGDEFRKCIVKLKTKDNSPWVIDDFKAQVKTLSVNLSDSSKTSVVVGIAPELKIEPKEQLHSDGGGGSGGSVKVDSHLVEDLSNIAVDLMVLRKQFSTHCKIYSTDETLKSLVTLLDKNIDLIYDKAVHLRKMPVSSLFLKAQRVIRDLSIKLGKPVEVRVSGESVEVDRVIVELLADPLMHITRNSLDHGIESLETRKKCGKPEKGTIHLEAYQTGGKVVIKIIDDGGGINREKIVKKAKEKGLLPESADSKTLTDKQVFDFVFAPGFSTAEKVTDVSGRGVGMDVVKTNLEKIKGVIDLETLDGKGTTLTITIPLSTAITDGMTFKIGSQFYILPMDAIVQITNLGSADFVKMPNGQELVKYRNQVYSFFRLEDLFKKQGFSAEIVPSDFTRIILFNTTKQIVAVRIDEILGKTEAIIRPLGDGFEKAHGISGASLLGNGHLALVLDPLGLEKVFSQDLESPLGLELVA